MAEKRALAVASIEIADIPVDGSVATVWESLGVIYKDTAQIEGDEGEEFVHEAEELDDPIEIESTKGRTKITWGVTDYAPAKLVKSLGGTVTGTGATEKWEESSVSENIEKQVRVTSKNGVTFIYPRTKIRARQSYKLSKSGIAQVLISATKMQPNNAAVAPCIIQHPV